MKVKSAVGAVIALWCAVLTPALAAAEPVLRIHVAAHAFVVTVSPVDAESRNADNSILYQRRGQSDAWVSLGPCEKRTMPDGEIRFTREVAVTEDGLYFYTSRPVVGGNAAPPAADSPPQAAVVVDTLPPTAEFLAPPEEAVLTAGQPSPIRWRAADENLAERPAALIYSPDAGRNWLPIADNLPAEGEQPWTPPADMRGEAVIRLTAVDKAGNVGRAVRRVEVREEEKKEPENVDAPVPSEPEKKGDEPVASAPPAKPAEVLERPAPQNEYCKPNSSWLYYLMAVNMMRQNRPRDALQYYWLSVREDQNFVEAWADIALAYIDLGAYKTAREVVERARELDPARIDLMHLLGETYHAEGMALLGEAKTPEDRLKAKGLIDQAVEWYGRALESAADAWTLAERAPSYYRLGEICYYVNMDRDGARAYWKKILDLHSPYPNYDLVLWSDPEKREEAKERYQRYTYQRAVLDTWQTWARGYLEQLDSRERAGVLDLMPVQRITRAGYGTACGEGEDEGRSLFSLPPQYGSSSARPAGSGESPAPRSSSMKSASPMAKDQSFYGGKPDAKQTSWRVEPVPARRPAGGVSMFSGGADAPPPPNPDPYAFPQRDRKQADWQGTGPYGDRPGGEW